MPHIINVKKPNRVLGINDLCSFRIVGSSLSEYFQFGSEEWDGSASPRWSGHFKRKNLIWFFFLFSG